MATVDIELYYDLDRRRWTTSAGGLAAQPSLFIGQSNTIDFKVRFVQGGVPIELTNPSFIAGVKVTDDPLGDYLLLTTTGTKTGAGATTIYTFTLNIDSVELQAYLVGITPTTNSTAFEVRDTVNNIATLPAITCSILPDYTLTGATPAAGSGTLVVDSGATFTVHKTFAMPVDDGQNNYVLKTNGEGVGSWAAISGTGTVTNVAVTTANGVSGTVANPTSNAAITLALGAITPTTGAFTDETDATSSTSAPLKTAGGLAVAKSLYVGTFSYFGDHATFNGDVVCNEFRQNVAGDTNFTSNIIDPMLRLAPVANSENYLTIEPNILGSPVHIFTAGNDTDIGLHLRAKGAGYVNIEDGGDATKRIRFGAGGNSTGITTTIASSSTTSQTITLPNATGATTLAGLQMIQTFTAANTFSAVTSITNNTASTSSVLGALKVTGGIAVALTTDAINSTNGGAMTIAGGLAVNAKMFVGGTAAFSGAITCVTASATGNLTFGAPISTPQAQGATGTTSPTSISTYITALTSSTTTGAIATLANGTNGQTKIIQAVSITGVGTTVTLTPATKTGYSTIVFSATGNTVMLCYHTTQGWMVVSNNGCTIA